MAHFAKIEKNTVTQVIVVSNDNCGGGEFPESEAIGQEFLRSIGLEGLWLQTSYHAKFRGRYANETYRYDTNLDIFIAPKVEEDEL